MGTSSPSRHPLRRSPHLLIAAWSLCVFFPLALLRFYFYPYPATPLPQPLPSAPPPPTAGIRNRCDFSKGGWVGDEAGPLYNDTSCGTIKEAQRCIAHGRPDRAYLHYRWRPRGCSRIPPFQPRTFFRLLRNKHLAFVGDSMARNQLESLLCMLATASAPQLLYTSGEDNKFRSWAFPSHNLTVSLYWSPFLVKGVEKPSGGNYNELYLDQADERWASDVDRIDVILLSVGHWFLHPAIYYQGDRVLGCHYCPATNYSEIGFYGVFGKALRTALGAVMEGARRRRGMRAVVTTFSPAHFEGEWDRAGACPKTAPYGAGEKELGWMDAEMRRRQATEVESAAKMFAESGGRVEALDVTELAMLRPDGHPGPYMKPSPFKNGVKDRVQNDCVHWCLPGPVDTWNEILLEVVKTW